MANPDFDQADHLASLLAKLPPGRAWPRDPDATQVAYWNGVADFYAVQTANAKALLADAFPANTVQLLPEWQASLGLPDPAGTDPRTATAQVVWKFASFSGPTPAAFTAFAAALGFTVTVESRAPFRAGQSRAGQRVGKSDWFFAWTITGPSDLATVTGLLTEVAPAHSILLFRYQD